jgi:uncharacterized membrane protein YhaH (DUF805 family)
MNFDSVFADPTGRLSRNNFVGGLVVLLLVVALYVFVAKAGRNGDWVLVTFLYPGFVMHARRLHDMGKTAWLLLVPGLPAIAFAWLHLFLPQSELHTPMGWLAAVLTVAFAAWGLVGKGEADANRFGAAA